MYPPEHNFGLKIRTFGKEFNSYNKKQNQKIIKIIKKMSKLKTAHQSLLMLL